jgi:hypothetical protein
MKTTGTKTMQMQSVATKAGRRDLLRPVEDRADHRLPHGEVPVRVLDLHGGVVDQDADREREAAERHHVERLAEERQRDDRHQDGERDRHHDDERRPPRAEKRRIMRPVSTAAMTASRRTPSIDARTNTDWSKSGLMLSSGGSVAAIRAAHPARAGTMSSVEAVGVFKTVSSAER